MAARLAMFSMRVDDTIKGDFVALAEKLDGKAVGFDPRHFSEIAEREERHFWFISRRELIEWLMQEYLIDAQRVLEIGCGTGFITDVLRKIFLRAKIAASDLHTTALHFARSPKARRFSICFRSAT